MQQKFVKVEHMISGGILEILFLPDISSNARKKYSDYFISTVSNDNHH